MFKQFKKFKRNIKGNVGMMAAIVMMPTVMAVGVSLDIANLNKEKHRLQDALDNATIAAIKARDSRRPDWSGINSLRAQLKAVGFSPDADNKARVINYRYKVSGSEVVINTAAQSKFKPAFGSLLGFKTIDVKARTRVEGPLKLSAVRFRPIYGSGYLHKDFDLYVKRPNVAAPERIATYTWRSSAPITNWWDQSSPGNLNSAPRGAVDLGDYETFFFSVRIQDPWNTYTHEQLVEVYGEDYTIWTNEAGKGDHFVVNGRTLPRDEFVNFDKEISCENRNQNFEWEDAPGLALPNTDFRFRVTAYCDGIDLDKLRISR